MSEGGLNLGAKSRKSSVDAAAGRPARLSREQVLDAAMALLQQNGGESFSLRQLAKRLDTVPGNLYTYFPSKEALFEVLAEQALAALELSLNTDLEWDQQLRSWMNSLRGAVKSHPGLPFLIGLAGTAPAALSKIDAVTALLQEQGMPIGSAVLHAQGLLWAVMGFAVFEIHASEARVVQRLSAADSAAAYPQIMAHLALQDLEPLWSATVDRSVEGLKALLEQAV
ncbi:MAG: AcrR family transcriptional regulator [Zhongshania aliphaticivorans]|jgi:AcrR family transcriptional regulator|uniref:TetR/AcrR family transcriptional regulator n=1 Tax=Zhongshania aliphaticivorans TaxID=1470434 RepID=UPI0039E710C6|tara:strand:+ start:2963 stop:3640 length:678 start_codon:yes stop_codon:yes gene_type:complete